MRADEYLATIYSAEDLNGLDLAAAGIKEMVRTPILQEIIAEVDAARENEESDKLADLLNEQLKRRR